MDFNCDYQKTTTTKCTPFPSAVIRVWSVLCPQVRKLTYAEQAVYGLQHKMTSLMDCLWSRCKLAGINLYGRFLLPFYNSNTRVPQYNRCYLTEFPINCCSSPLGYLTFRIRFIKVCALVSSLQKKKGSFLKDIYGNQFCQSACT